MSVDVLKVGCEWGVRETACPRCCSLLSYEPPDACASTTPEVREACRLRHNTTLCRANRHEDALWWVKCPVCENEIRVPDIFLLEPIFYRWVASRRERARRRASARMALTRLSEFRR